MIRDPLTLAALLIATTALAFWLDRRFPFFSRIGAALLVIIFGAVLSNLGIVPRASPVYDTIEGPVLSLAIVFLLFSVSLADLRQAGPQMLGAFALGAAGTAVAAFLGAWAFAPALASDTWKLAGAFTGTYTGGSLNFAAVGRALGLGGSTFAAASAADNVTTTVWMAVSLAIPVWFGRRWARARRARVAAAPANGERARRVGRNMVHPYWDRVEVSLFQLVILAALGVLILLTARAVSTRLPEIPQVLWLTTFALLAAQLPAVRRLRVSQALGNLGLHLFLALIGVYSIIGEIAQVGLAVFYYTLWVVGGHALVLFGAGWLARADLRVLCVATQACIGGPSTAMAIAVARGWPWLLVPGVAAALLGYAVGNYLGLGVAYLTRGLLGG